MPIVVNIKPVVIKGGTFDSARAGENYSEFNVFNSYGVGGPRNENMSLRMYFNYTETSEDDEFVYVRFNGISRYTFTITSVGRNGQFPVIDTIRDNGNAEIKTYRYTSGVGYTINDTLRPTSPFSAFDLKVPKDGSLVKVSRKLARFDDVAPADPSGDNFIELWMESIYYKAPPRLKPWAVRKSGVFKTLNVPSGWFRIRQHNNWNDASYNENSDVGAVNKGHSRIRKSGSWKGQNKFGQ